MTDDAPYAQDRYDEIALTLDDRTTACDYQLRELEIELGLNASETATPCWTSGAASALHCVAMPTERRISMLTASTTRAT